MVEDLGAADGGGRRGFQAELRPRKAEELVSALLADTKEIDRVDYDQILTRLGKRSSKPRSQRYSER